MSARKSANSNLPLFSGSMSLAHSVSSTSVGVWYKDRTRSGSCYVFILDILMFRPYCRCLCRRVGRLI